MVTNLQLQLETDKNSRGFEASLVYIMSSKLAEAMKLDCLKKPKQTNKHHKIRRKGREGGEGGKRDVSLTSLESQLSNR